MACNIEHKRLKGVESELGKELINIFGDLDKAKEMYDTLASEEFIEQFGDWINTDIIERTNDTNEPLLVSKTNYDNSVEHFFLDKNNDRIPLIVREFSSFDDLNLTNVIKEITEQLSSFIFKKHIKENFNDITNIQRIDVSKEIGEFVSNKKSELEDYLSLVDEEDKPVIQEGIDKLNKVLKHKDEFVIEVNKFFKSRHLNIDSTGVTEDDIQDRMYDGLQGGDIVQSIEKNSKDNATSNVKLALSFLPKYEYNPDENTFEKKYGSAIGEELFVSMDVVHKELLRELADIITLPTEVGVGDMYEQMLSKIKELAVKKPYFNDLIDILDSFEEEKRTEFVSAFNNTKINYYTGILKGSVVAEYKMFNATRQKSVAERLLKEWNFNFKRRFVNFDKKKLDVDSIKNVDDTLQELIIMLNKERKGLDFNSITEDEFVSKFETSMDGLFESLKALGVSNITYEGFNLFLNKIGDDSNSFASVFNKLQGTLVNLKKITGALLVSPKKTKVNIFEDNKSYIFGSLAQAEAFYKEDTSEDTIRRGSKMYWSYSKPSYLSNTINAFKTHKQLLVDLLERPINRHSVWAKHLLGLDSTTTGDYKYSQGTRNKLSDSRLEKLELGIFNSFQLQDKSSEAVDNREISTTDMIVDEMNKVLRGTMKSSTGKKLNISPIYSSVQAADKSTRYELSIDYFVPDTLTSIQSSNNMKFSREVMNIFLGYFEDEINRMRDEYRKLDLIKPSEYVVHYHTVKGKLRDVDGFLLGNAFRSQVFPELSPTPEFVNSELNKDLQLYTEKGEPMFTEEIGLTPQQRSKLASKINEILTNRVRENVRLLEDYRILQRQYTKDNEFAGYTTRGIDARILNSGYKEVHESTLTPQSIANLVSDYTINAIISKIEYTKLFTGDPAFYKNMVDFFKRVPATYTDGINLRLGMGDDAFFKAAVIENQEVKSKYLDAISKSLDKTKATKEEKAYILKAYENVNQTDAQAWITPERWAFLISRLGKWNDKYESVYNKMKTGEALTADELKSTAQPLKGVYFGIVNGIPTYLKYSQAVLTPQLVKGNDLQKMYDTLQKGNIQEAITLDGVKVGAYTPNQIDADSYTSIVLSNMNWKLQQDLPSKLIKSTLLGSQIQKNIYGSIDINSNTVYTTDNGDTYSSSEIIDEINDTISNLSNVGIDNLSLELGRDDEGRINNSRFYELMERDLTRRDFPTNIIKSLQKNLPIEAIPGVKDKIYNTLFSLIKKSAVKIETNGGSFIQVSNYGLDRVTADEVGVKWLLSEEEISELKPPIIKDGKVQPGQVFISHSQIAKYFPNYESMSLDELKSKIDSRVLRAIGYRIPNQGMSSNDALQIVGILPANVQDSIVAYTEIPTKTGSDFDIDKMYAMLPSIGIKMVPSRTFKKAYQYIEDNELTEEEMLDELSHMNIYPESSNIKKVFAKEVLIENQSDSAYQEDFLDIIGEGDVEKINYVEYDKYSNSKKKLQNKLFELYWSVLTNVDTYSDLIAPIDFPHIKNHIKQIHGDTTPSGHNLQTFDPLFQLELKRTYLGGKGGVGLTANQLVDHFRSKDINMSFTDYYLGIGHQNEADETLFDQEYSQTLNGTKFKVSHTISAFLNAFVDNAKDPYIELGNYNIYTANIAFMLIRAGVHPYWMNAFIGQPILKELVSFTDSYESQSIPKDEDWKSAKQVLEEKYIQLYLDLGGSMSAVTEYEKIKSETFGNAPLIMPTYESLIDSLDREELSHKDGIWNQLEILNIFNKFQNQARKLGESVQLSRFDTEAAGKDYLDMLVYINRVKEILGKETEKGEISGHSKKYIRNGKLTSLGTEIINTLEYSREILESNPDLFLLASTNILELMNNISYSKSNPWGGSRGLLKDRELGKIINDNLYTYILSDFSKLVNDVSPKEFINKTIEDIMEYKREKSSLPEDEQNIFINSLEIFEESVGMFNNNLSTSAKDELYRSFRDLMSEEPEFADRLIKTLFIQNGFTGSLIDFREFIPHEWFIQNNFKGFLRDKFNNINTSIQYLSGFERQFVRNNFNNNILAPKLSKRVTSTEMPDGTKLNRNHAVTIKIESYDKYKGYVLNGREDITKYKQDPIFVPYVKIGDNNLYELAGYFPNGQPLYIRISTLGYESKSSHLNIKEYSSSRLSMSKFAKNNISIPTQDEFEAIMNKIGDDFEFGQKPIDAVINKNYIKNLSDILLNEKNIVSLQDKQDFDKDNNTDCIF